LDLGPVIGGYVGLIFLGGAYLALGLFVSSLTENQIIAFILGVVSCFILFIIGQPFVTSGLPNFVAILFQYLGLGTHFESIGRGVLDSRDIIYYVSFICFFLFCNYKSIEARSWK
jgi:ABC-2 type transport system permease protein